MFVLDELAGVNQISSGTLTDTAGHPQVGVLVELQVGNRTYKTLTNRHGGYNFYVASPAIAAKLPATGQIAAGGVTKSVTLRSATPTLLQIPAAKPVSPIRVIESRPQ